MSTSIRLLTRRKSGSAVIVSIDIVTHVEWSRVFDGTTMGLSGLVEVKIDEEEPGERCRYLNFGIKFEQGEGSFSRTKIIKIVPRYIIMNTLEEDIHVKQKGTNDLLTIKASEKLKVYNFFNKEKDPYIQLSDGDLSALREDENLIIEASQESDAQWSSAFSIDDIADFQVEFASDYRGQEVRGGTFQSSRESFKAVKAWHAPNENNYFRRILRVIVNTQDDATIFVKICRPKFPEYYIFNDTTVPVQFQQFKCPE